MTKSQTKTPSRAPWKRAVGAGAVILLGLVALRMATHRAPDTPAGADTTPAPHTGHAADHAAHAPAQVAPDAAAPPRLSSDGAGAGDLAADPVRDPAEDQANAPPLPTPDQVRARPARPERTPEEATDHAQQTRQASLALVERSIERLEAERAAAEQAGDEETARRNRIRIERLRQRRAALQAEAAGAP